MDYYSEIKNELINNEVYKKVKDYSKNKSDLNTYYSVGKLLKDAGKHYGEGIIKEYSIKLEDELGKKYNERTLRKYRQFYLLFNEKKWSTMSTVLEDNFFLKLYWSHYMELLSLKDINEINYYIKISIEQNLSVRELRYKIKTKEYQRLDDKTKGKLINKEENKIEDFIKTPILIKNSYNYKNISEKILKQLILEDIDNFLKELGNGFSYISNEYKIKLGNNYNYIDILLFNYIYNSFVVVELKITELKKEYIGQIEVYMNYINKEIKSINQDKTIGIIICKKDNKYVMEYVSDKRIYMSIYSLI